MVTALAILVLVVTLFLIAGIIVAACKGELWAAVAFWNGSFAFLTELVGVCLSVVFNGGE